jgi:hypothetical protein
VNLQATGTDARIEEAAADKGYHAANTIELADSLNVRTYKGPSAQRSTSSLMAYVMRSTRGGLHNGRHIIVAHTSQRFIGELLLPRRLSEVQHTLA